MEPIKAIEKLIQLGVKQSVLEQYMGLRSGKLSELLKGHSKIKAKDSENIIAGFNAFKAEIAKIEIDSDFFENNYSVYVHIFPNDKRYYGISISPEERWGKDGNGYQN